MHFAKSVGICFKGQTFDPGPETLLTSWVFAGVLGTMCPLPVKHTVCLGDPLKWSIAVEGEPTQVTEPQTLNPHSDEIDAAAEE